MKDFQKIDWKTYNKPPYWQQWLCRDDTLKLATFGDKGLEEVDDHILSLKDQWDLDNVEGHFLDRIGKLLSELRNGNTDDHYRILLQLRRLLNTNDGSVPDIIKTIKFIYSSEIVHIVPDYPAGLIIEHDGEGTPGLNFNKLLNEIIPAGVSFSTKELFYITDEFEVSEIIEIIVRRKDVEYFRNSIKYNGMIKYDGHTVNEWLGIYGRHDGRFQYNGNLKYNGTGKLAPPYRPTPPFKYSSGIYDLLSLTTRGEDFTDFFNALCFHDGSIKYNGHSKYNGRSPYPGNDPTMIITVGKNISDNEAIGESHDADVVVDYETDTKKNTKFNGKVKYNGLYFHTRDYVDKLSVGTPGGDVTDTAALNDESFIGIRHHHFFDGAYAYGGSIKYNGMALIPLG